MTKNAPVNDERTTCGLRISSGGSKWVCISARHPGSEAHYFRKENQT